MDAQEFRIETLSPRAMRSQLVKVRLSLARGPERPCVGAVPGYVVVAPLDADARLDAGLWNRRQDQCRVTRLCPDGSVAFGRLTYGLDAAGARWRFDFGVDAGDELDIGTTPELGRLRPGDRLAISNFGEFRPYRIDAVWPFAPDVPPPARAAPCPTAAALRAAPRRAVAF